MIAIWKTKNYIWSHWISFVKLDFTRFLWRAQCDFFCVNNFLRRNEPIPMSYYRIPLSWSFFWCGFMKFFTFFEKSRRKDKDLCTITELFAKLKDFYRWLPIRSCSFVKKGRRAEIFYKTKQIAFIFSTLTETSFLERQLEFIPLYLTVKILAC